MTATFTTHARALRALSRAVMLRHAMRWIMTGPPPDARRVEMPDGTSWRVVRRHEMARILTRRDSAERRLYLLFFGDHGSFRRAEVRADFPDPVLAPVSDLVEAWQRAEQPQ